METNPVAEAETAPSTTPVAEPVAKAPEPQEPSPTPSAPSDPLDAALAAMQAEKAELDKAQEPKQEPQATEAAPVEPVQPATPEGDTPPEPKAERVLPHRVSTAQFSETEQQAIALGKALKDAGEPVPSLKERIEIIEARQKAAPPATAPEPEPQHDSALAELETKLAAAVAKKKEIATQLGTEDLVAAQDEIDQLRQQKNEIESQKAKHASAKHTVFADSRTKSIEAAKSQFPSSTDPDSDLSQAIAAHIAEIKGDPARSGLLNDPKAPEVIAAESAMKVARIRAADNGTTIASELASLMQEAVPPAKAAAPAPAIPVAQVRKPTTAGGAASTPPANPPAPRIPTGAELANMSYEELEKVMPTKRSGGFVLRV